MYEVTITMKVKDREEAARLLNMVNYDVMGTMDRALKSGKHQMRFDLRGKETGYTVAAAHGAPTTTDSHAQTN